MDTHYWRKTRKLLAVLLALAMVLGMAGVAGAADYPAYDLRVGVYTVPVEINGAIWEMTGDTTPSGTGVFNTYLAVDHNSGVYQGYNNGDYPWWKDGSDPTATKNDPKPQFNESDSKTSALPLVNVPTVKIGDIVYREFVCDINEATTTNLLSLDRFQIWQTNDGDITDYPWPTGIAVGSEPRLVYDIDSPGQDTYLILDYLVNSGSGKHDYRVLLPNSWFETSYRYVVMFVRHGDVYKGTGGFEEWGVKKITTYTTTTTTKLFKEAGATDTDLSTGVIPGNATTYHHVTIGDVLYDTATVTSSVGTPSGTVQFEYLKPGAAVWTLLGPEIPLDGAGKATSGNVTADVAGTWFFRAAFTPTVSMYHPSRSGDLEEPVIVDKADTTTTTKLYKVVGNIYLDPAGGADHVVIGTEVYDTALVTSGYGTPEGNVKFEYKAPGGPWTTLDASKTLVDGAATSSNKTLDTVGEWLFRATYSGGTNWNTSASGDNDEPVIVDKADTTTTTKLYAGSTYLDPTADGIDHVAIGTTVYDTAKVTSGYATPAGNVKFEFKAPGDDWTTLDASVALNGSGEATSSNKDLNTVGTWYFRAVYAGGTNWNGSQSDDEAEPVIVDKANTTTTTMLWLVVVDDEDVALDPSSEIPHVTIGDWVYDTAHVSSTYGTPAGNVQFQYWAPGGGDWVNLGGTVVLDGSGNATSSDKQLTVVGTWYFRAVYAGGTNWNGSQSGDEEEPVIVDPADTTTETMLYTSEDVYLDPSDGTDKVALGTVVYDTAKVTSDWGTPTGSVQFKYWGPNDGDWVDLGTPVALDSNGEATSDPKTLDATGMWYFRACYIPDASWNASCSGAEAEPVEVEQCYYDETAWAFGNIENNTVAKSSDWGWTNGPLTGGTYTRTLWAGAGGNDTSKGMDVGTVTIVVAGNTVTVTYETTGGAYLAEVHLWIGNTELPKVKQGKSLVFTSAPGQLGIDGSLLGTFNPDNTEWTYSKTLSGGPIYVAAHAVVMIPGPCDMP